MCMDDYSDAVYSYNDDFTWIRGSHTLKFGAGLQINHYNGFGRQCEAGCVGFNFTQTYGIYICYPTQDR